MLDANSINPQSALPLYVQIVDSVREAILVEDILPGQPLPSVRGLANELKVNSLTIQKAYKILEGQGLIEIKKGVGAFISNEINPVDQKSKYQIIDEKISPIIKQAKNMQLEKEKILKLVEKKWSTKS